MAWNGTHACNKNYQISTSCLSKRNTFCIYHSFYKGAAWEKQYGTDRHTDGRTHIRLLYIRILWCPLEQPDSVIEMLVNAINHFKLLTHFLV